MTVFTGIVLGLLVGVVVGVVICVLDVDFGDSRLHTYRRKALEQMYQLGKQHGREEAYLKAETAAARKFLRGRHLSVVKDDDEGGDAA